MFYFREDVMFNRLLILIVDKTYYRAQNKVPSEQQIHMLHSIVVVSSYMFRLPVVLLICILRVAVNHYQLIHCYLDHTNYRSDNTHDTGV